VYYPSDQISPDYSTICSIFKITGDFNFQCCTDDKGYEVCLSFANVLHLIACDNLDLVDTGYTYLGYFHEGLRHKSFLDHFFVPNEL